MSEHSICRSAVPDLAIWVLQAFQVFVSPAGSRIQYMCFKGRCCVGQTHWNLVGPVLLVALGLLGSGCATTHTRTGQSGHIEWEAICCSFFGSGGWSFTVVLRETG